jgi:DNA-binding transcriptional MerR regulator
MASVSNGPWEPLGYVARNSGSSEQLVRRYDRLGLIESRRNLNNQREFPPGTAEKVRAIREGRASRKAG